MLTSQQQASFKQKLQRQKKELLSHLEQNDHYDLESAAFHDSVDELSNYDNHPGDNASYLYEREKDIALNEHAEDELKNIQHALEKSDQGQYGVCEKCGKDIPIERLEALPTTTFCIEHSQDQEETMSRPIEEEIIQPGLRRMSDEESDTNFYDAEDSWQDVARYGTSETPSDFSGQDIDNYSETYINSDEPLSHVEDYENFTGVDMYGKEVRVYPNTQHEEYEEDLDESGMMSVAGELHVHETDGYVDEEAKEEEEDDFWK